MTAVTPRLLSYPELRQRLRTHMLRQFEVPIEYAISLPLPTLRCGRPGYACFASASLHRPGEPVVRSAPDRWWVLDAAGAQILIYSRTSVQSFAPDLPTTTITLPNVPHTLEEMSELLDNTEAAIDAVVPAFFAGEAGAPESRQAALAALEAFLPAPLLPQYEALTPDFFAWLRR